MISNPDFLLLAPRSLGNTVSRPYFSQNLEIPYGNLYFLSTGKYYVPPFPPTLFFAIKLPVQLDFPPFLFLRCYFDI